jgi:hypothetical protein
MKINSALTHILYLLVRQLIGKKIVQTKVNYKLFYDENHIQIACIVESL